MPWAGHIGSSRISTAATEPSPGSHRGRGWPDLESPPYAPFLKAGFVMSLVTDAMVANALLDPGGPPGTPAVGPVGTTEPARRPEPPRGTTHPRLSPWNGGQRASRHEILSVGLVRTPAVWLSLRPFPLAALCWPPLMP